MKMTMIIIAATLASAVLSAALFYLGLRLGLKVGSKSREPLYPTDDSGTIEQEYSE